MKEVISSKKKYAKILRILLGHSLMGIGVYISFRLTTFILQQIDIPFNLNDFAVAASVIVVTMYATSMLLRYDSKVGRKPVFIDHGYEKETN